MYIAPACTKRMRLAGDHEIDTRLPSDVMSLCRRPLRSATETPRVSEKREALSIGDQTTDISYACIIGVAATRRMLPVRSRRT